MDTMEQTQAKKPENAAFAALDERYERLPIDWIVPSKTNPRRHFDEAYLTELADSIRDKGVIEPIIVRELDVLKQVAKHPEKAAQNKARFEIVAGECRYRASVEAALTHVPAVVRRLTDEQVLEIQIEENLHRKDLTPLEEAAAYRRLIDVNPDKHSASSIATRVGMSPSYIWDYLKLLDLVPEAKAILEQKLMAVGHAILIARLKPEDQARVIAFDDDRSTQYRGVGLWRHDYGFAFDEDDPSNKGKKPGKYDGLKPCSVRELDAWIRDHIRFDVEHAAKAQPLVFEDTAAQVEEAAAIPGRGKKVIHITRDYRVADDARDEHERTYGENSWERADGKNKSKTCEHSVLGVFVAGDGYGTTLQVCVARDKCLVHFGQVVRAKQKAAKERDAGHAKKADKTESAQLAKEKRQREENERAAKAWQKLEPLLAAEAIDQVKGAKAVSAAAAKMLADIDFYDAIDLLKKHLGATWFKTPAAAWMVIVAADRYQESFDDYIKNVAKPLGLNIKRLEAIRDKHQPAAPAAGKKAKAGKAA